MHLYEAPYLSFQSSLPDPTPTPRDHFASLMAREKDSRWYVAEPQQQLPCSRRVMKRDFSILVSEGFRKTPEKDDRVVQ